MSTGSSTTTQTQSNPIANMALPYVQQGLGAASTLINKPYQAYEGQQLAQFSPLQNQAFEGAANIQPSELTQSAGSQALGAGQSYVNAATDPYMVQSYMSPYQQAVIDTTQRNAIRNADIAGQARNAQAVKAGAFGGSRQAIENAEANRNLQQQLSDIQTQGMQSAYDKAMQSMQYGAGLGLQGAQAAGNLGNLGFQQGMDINKLQNLYGTQQQAQTQMGLDLAKQQFQEQQQYPYKNLAFLSDMYRGLPLSGTGATTTTAPAPGIAQQIAGLGTGLYGLSKMKDGGHVEEEFAGLSGAGLYRSGSN